MNEQQILQAAIDAREADGPKALVEVFIDRLPVDPRYTAYLRLRPDKGPRGRIIALTPTGSKCQFEAVKLISFLGSSQTAVDSKKKLQHTEDRHRLHAFISGESYQAISAYASASKLSLGAIVDAALSQYLQGSTI